MVVTSSIYECPQAKSVVNFVIVILVILHALHSSSISYMLLISEK